MFFVEQIIKKRVANGNHFKASISISNSSPKVIVQCSYLYLNVESENHHLQKLCRARITARAWMLPRNVFFPVRRVFNLFELVVGSCRVPMHSRVKILISAVSNCLSRAICQNNLGQET